MDIKKNVSNAFLPVRLPATLSLEDHFPLTDVNIDVDWHSHSCIPSGLVTPWNQEGQIHHAGAHRLALTLTLKDEVVLVLLNLYSWNSASVTATCLISCHFPCVAQRNHKWIICVWVIWYKDTNNFTLPVCFYLLRYFLVLKTFNQLSGYWNSLHGMTCLFISFE